MVFSSLLFLFRFLPVFFLLYVLAPRRTKNFVLFLGSLVFYAWGEPVYVCLMLFSTLSDYVHGLVIERMHARNKTKWAGFFLVTSVVINLGLLGLFKYTDFLIGTVNSLTGLSLPLMQLPLPIGISFYTFQTMSYTIDVYRKKVPAQRNIITFGAFVAMFPQLIAGPIVQYKDVQKELESRRITPEGATQGVRRFLMGLGKKVLLANQAGALYETLLAQGNLTAAGAGLIEAGAGGGFSVAGAWLCVLCFAFQIYFDFSGYSDMAVGLGRIMGFYFPENFRYPYVADSVTDFWRRWHMTLSGWFREYVYIPLGGNRKGIRRQVFNILAVWFLTGIWHGASWNFLFWGLWFGVFLIIEKLFLLRHLPSWPRVLRMGYTFLIVLGGWVLFSQTAGSSIAALAMSMVGLGSGGFLNRALLYEVSSNWLLLIVFALGATPLPARLGNRLLKAAGDRGGQLLETVWLLLVLVLSVAFLVDASYNPFLYFRF